MKKVNSNQLTAEQQRELDALSAMADVHYGSMLT